MPPKHPPPAKVVNRQMRITLVKLKLVHESLFDILVRIFPGNSLLGIIHETFLILLELTRKEHCNENTFTEQQLKESTYVCRRLENLRAEMALCETQNTDTMISELFKSGQMANTLVRQLVNRWYCNETSIRCREIMEKQGMLKEALHRSEIKNDILSNALCSIFCMSWKVSERQRRRAMLGELLIGYFDELLDAEASVPEDLSSREMPKQRNCRELVHCLSNFIRDCCFNNNLNMERRKGHHSPSRSRMRSKRAEDDARARSKRRGKRSRTRHSKRRSRSRSERCRRKRSAMPRSGRNSEEEERKRDFLRFLKDEEDDWDFLSKATCNRKF